MTLAISLVKTDPITGRREERLLPGIAGFEETRSKLWGTDIVRSLGAKFLPRLSEMNLAVEGDELHDFRREVEMLIANVDVIARETYWDKSYVSRLLGNYRSAIDECISEGAVLLID